MAGAIAVVGWAPYEWWWIGVFGYAVLWFLLARSQGSLDAAFLGLTFGAGLHLTGHGWVTQALHTKVGMAVMPSLFCTVFFALYLALFTAVPCGIWCALNSTQSNFPAPEATQRAGKNGLMQWISAITLASLLTTGEWARGILFNGFTSLSFGYSFIDTWLAGYAPVLGVYGVSWIGFLAVGCLMPHVWAQGGWAKCTFLLLTFVVGLGLGRIDWVRPAGKTLSYRLVQSNVSQEEKFDPAFRTRHVEQLVSLIKRQPADLIVTPETAFPLFLNELPASVLTDLQDFSEASTSNLFLGMATSAANGESYNSVVEVSPNTHNLGQYRKVRLMPFGEYTPSGFGWFSNSLNVPLKDLTAGSIDQAPLDARGQNIGVLICHEDFVGGEARRWANVATVMINPSNLGWFEKTLAIEQRLQIVRMRAAEMGRPFLRTTNTGITAHIDHKGRVVKQLPSDVEGVLTGAVLPVTGTTPYVLLGDWPMLLACMISIVVGLIYLRRVRRVRHAYAGRADMLVVGGR